MLKNLVLNEGDTVDIEYISLPVARFAKFQAQSVDFLDITNQKAVYVQAVYCDFVLSKPFECVRRTVDSSVTYSYMSCGRLESALRSFACLTAGDMIEIKYNNKVHKLAQHIFGLKFQLSWVTVHSW